MGPFRALLNWVSLADYEDAKEQATIDVVSRYAPGNVRGNVSAQNGQIMDESELLTMARNGDNALAHLDRLRRKG